MKLQEETRLFWRKKAKKVPDIREITWISETGSTNDLAKENFSLNPE
ncbi:MAG: hypothetical protein JRF43_07220 [Deltaproteobacteria bacterium]|nr:hypothetical protein [Deltaproteobacteria bacterium]